AGLQQALSEHGEPEISCTVHLGRRLAAERHELDSFTQVVSRCDVDRQATRVAIEHTALARATRAADLVHHGGGTLPIVRSSTPTVLTIHDLQYLRFPQYFSSSRRRYLQAMMPRSARVATTITTPTAHVADDVARSFSVDREKIVVVPHGVPTLTADPAEVQHQREVLGNGQPLVVYPAITHPHKGHLRLIAAMQRLRDAKLVLIGGVGSAEDDVLNAIAASPHPEQVIRMGRVSDEMRNALIAAADVVAIPSEEEGFGAPVIEAMTLGTPVVCSDIGALREVAGNAAILVGHEPENIADGISHALESRDTLLSAASARVRDFTLEASGSALRSA
ncbi:MAG: glycosyltransferase family 1 protein, partial [Actinomycetota bacterium]|nr:glycosyltransferase family 1 protein [Actinomycetota bacterium]